MDDLAAAKILIRSLDLTSLNESDTADSIENLCTRAVTPFGNAAAICIYPKFIPLALDKMSSGIRIATVVNFPEGNLNFNKLEKEIKRALASGADEIDAVFPYHDFLAGRLDECRTFLAFTRELCANHPLKIILETGELGSISKIKEAARLAIEGGADFVKTSTGKSKISATPEAANAILETLKASGREVGFKASGGIKTLDDAKKYLVLAASIMGPGWITPHHFRIGASSLLRSLLETIKKGY